MKVLKHLLILVATIVTGRADVKPERIRRDGNQLPVGGKVGAYGSSSVNPNTDAQLSIEIGEGGANKEYGLQTPSGFDGLNEAGESFGAETKTVAGYDGYGLAPPSEGFGYENQFKTPAQASALTEVHTGETTANGGAARANATTQAKFGQRAQQGTETQADAIIQENQGVQYDDGTKVQTPHLGMMSINILMNSGPPDQAEYSLVPGYVKPLINQDDGTKVQKPNLKIMSFSEFLNSGSLGLSEYSLVHNQYDDGTKVQKPYLKIMPFNEFLNSGLPGLAEYSLVPGYVKPMVNGYEVTQSPNWNKKGFFYNNFKWYPYTKPAQGETLVQADRKIEADALTQENGEPQYQEENQAYSMVQTSKGVTTANADAEAGYDGQYNAETQPGEMAQINSGSQYETSALADAMVQSSGGVQYSAENKLTSSAQAVAQFQTNVASSYSGVLQHNGGAPYVGGSGPTGAEQSSEGMKYGAKYSESALYADTGKYKSGSLNGEGFQANAKNQLQSGVQYGGAVSAEAVAQAGTVVETRFGQGTHPPRRPMPGFGYRHPYNNVRNHG